MDSDTKKFQEEHPPEKFDRKEFNFSTPELIRLCALETLAQTFEKYAQDQRLMMQGFLNTFVLPRVGLKPDPRNGIMYDTFKGNFFVYVPKEDKAVNGKDATK